MSYALSETFSVGIQAGVAATVPAWLQGKAINEWVPIPGSHMGNMDMAPLIAAGLTDNTGADIGFQRPASFSALGYFGGTLRSEGSYLLIFGGGGARSWAGNEVRKLQLSADTPRWMCHNNPTPSSGIWFNSYHNTVLGGGQQADPSTPYMRDGISPNARHAYWQPQFINSTDRFMLFGCDNVWQTDSGIYANVDSLEWDTAAWNAPGTHPALPQLATVNSHPIVKHPVTEKVYNFTDSKIYEYDPATNAWTQVFTTVSTGNARRACCIDSSRDKILSIGLEGGVQNIPATYNMSTWTKTVATFSGPFASSINEPTLYWANGFVYDPELDCFLMYQDDGFMYTITYVSDSEYSVDRLSTTGTAPTAGTMTYVGNPEIWGKVQYVPALKGVVLCIGGDNVPTYFIKTA